jgi:protoheme IX farnesyltransferase
VTHPAGLRPPAARAPTETPKPGPESSDALLSAARFGDFVQLTKPRLTTLVVVTTLVGYLAGRPGPIHWLVLLQTLAGTFAVAAAASALNQLAERDLDAAMSRTRSRPLPGGRLAPRQALAFGTLLLGGGATWLAVAVSPLASFLAVLTAAFYLLAYTPLKTITPVATLVGAIPGAIPPMIGWAAARGTVDFGSFSLFLILFFWQMPHFLAIATICRADYAAAGFRVLSVVDPGGRRTGRQAVLFASALIPVSVLPAFLHLAGPWYAAGAVALGAWYTAASVQLLRHPGDLDRARALFRLSLLYLPALLLLLVAFR